MMGREWYRDVKAHDLKHTNSSVKHGGGNVTHKHAWLPAELCPCFLLMMSLLMGKAGWILRRIGLYLASATIPWCVAVNLIKSPTFNPVGLLFTFCGHDWMQKEMNKQQLKPAAVKARQSVSGEETQHLIRSMGSRLQIVIDCNFIQVLKIFLLMICHFS